MCKRQTASYSHAQVSKAKSFSGLPRWASLPQDSTVVPGTGEVELLGEYVVRISYPKTVAGFDLLVGVVQLRTPYRNDAKLDRTAVTHAARHEYLSIGQESRYVIEARFIKRFIPLKSGSRHSWHTRLQ